MITNTTLPQQFGDSILEAVREADDLKLSFLILTAVIAGLVVAIVALYRLALVLIARSHKAGGKGKSKAGPD